MVDRSEDASCLLGLAGLAVERVVLTVGQPAGTSEPGLVHPQHRDRCGLDELDRAVHHDRPLHRRPRHPCAAATSACSRPFSTATASAVRSRVVVRIPAGTCPTCSVKLCRAQPSVRHRQRRFRHCTSANSPPHGRSRGRVNTQSFPDVDSDPHTGQRAASGSSVTS